MHCFAAVLCYVLLPPSSPQPPRRPSSYPLHFFAAAAAAAAASAAFAASAAWKSLLLEGMRHRSTVSHCCRSANPAVRGGARPIMVRISYEGGYCRQTRPMRSHARPHAHTRLPYPEGLAGSLQAALALAGGPALFPARPWTPPHAETRPVASRAATRSPARPEDSQRAGARASR